MPGGSQKKSRPTSGFEDVWALPAQGRLEDFAKLPQVVALLSTPRVPLPRRPAPCSASATASANWLGTGTTRNTPIHILEAARRRERALPEDLRDTATGVEPQHEGLHTSWYRKDVEWAV